MTGIATHGVRYLRPGTPIGLRLLARIDVRDDHECWPWTATRMKRGHGQLRVGKKALLAHRAVWEWNNGPVPAGLYVRHMCNHGWCCNPNHLAPGTHADNMADAAVFGTQRGVNNPSARLTEADVRAIRAAVAGGETQTSVCLRYGLGGGTVSQIVNRLRWRHVA